MSATEPWKCEGCGWTNIGYVHDCDGCGETKRTAVLDRAALITYVPAFVCDVDENGGQA